jgi:ubiquinone/menaquinone biosynthesis C-methylase UbiE
VTEGDGRTAAQQYGAMAVAYAERNENGSYNAYYERPATIGLLGDVAGLDVLEAGCGGGVLTEWLARHGARTTAFDVTPELVAMTRDRVGANAKVLVADLAEPLAFAPDDRFDLVVASLVLHYVRDWDHVLAEFRRVLRRDGAVVFSTHHPAMDWQLHTPEDYFAVRQVTEVWTGGFEVTFWRRPLSAMTESIAGAGFVIERLAEPLPRPELAGRNPKDDHAIRTEPRFLFFRLRPRPAEWGA